MLNPYHVDNFAQEKEEQWIYPIQERQLVPYSEVREPDTLRIWFRIIGRDANGKDKCVNFPCVSVNKCETLSDLVKYLWFFAKRSGQHRQGCDSNMLARETSGNLSDPEGWRVEMDKDGYLGLKQTYHLKNIINHIADDSNKSMQDLGYAAEFGVVMYSPGSCILPENRDRAPERLERERWYERAGWE